MLVMTLAPNFLPEPGWAKIGNKIYQVGAYFLAIDAAYLESFNWATIRRLECFVIVAKCEQYAKFIHCQRQNTRLLTVSVT